MADRDGLRGFVPGRGNRRWRMASRPVGGVRNENFRLTDDPVPTPGDGEFLIRTLYLSLAPVMRQYMIDGAGIERPLEIGDVIYGRGVGQVVASRHPGYDVGDIVHGKIGWQEYAISDGAPDKLMFKVRATGLSPSTALGVLGITGFTAYVGLFDLAEASAGKTVLVSGAAGGVGSVVGPLAKIAGCRVIGLAGTPEKRAMLVDRLGYDAAIDYRADDLDSVIAAAVPEGIDIFFDNVGGPVLDAALGRINRFARIVSCGRISQYLTGPNHALANWWRIGAQRARMEGFFIYDYAHRFAEAEAAMAGWIREGRLPFAEDVLDGIEQMPAALRRLFEGDNVGKQIVRVADPLPL
ncbi:MAG: NADP-dependent oxidoreductase [Alphaproteobacteria bacterium]|nr:NADP-dependent oxidoreductase [Alphaproteobacteria bacterium]